MGNRERINKRSGVFRERIRAVKRMQKEGFWRHDVVRIVRAGHEVNILMFQRGSFGMEER